MDGSGLPVTAGLDVPVPIGGGGGAEFWVSQGGVWVKAEEAFGSLAGAWEPVM